MAKTRTAYFCRECGKEMERWAGQCPACNEWNTLVEEPG
jgi:DNA repair protein RadA/Sms